MNSKTTTIAVIGLGYVGLPLAVEFGKQRNTIGFDIDDNRIKELAAGHDKTLEVDEEGLKSASKLHYTANAEDLVEANVYIVTVPTPIGPNKRPILTPLKLASETIGKVLQKGDVVI